MGNAGAGAGRGPVRRALFALALAASAAGLLAAAGPAGAVEPSALRALREGERVGEDALRALADSPRARVLVRYAMPELRGGGAGALAERRRAGEATAARILRNVPEPDFRVERRLPLLGAVAGSVTPAGLEALLAHPDVLRVELEGGGSGSLAESLPLAGFDEAPALGLRGAGVTVAVLDTGLDTDHPDLAPALVEERCYCRGDSNSFPSGCCPNGLDTQSGPGSAEDDNGHGTNVSGIIASAGHVAPEGGAPGVDLIAVKVLDSNNRFCCNSDVLAALEWILMERPEVDVVNMSLGTDVTFESPCPAVPFSMAVELLRARGTLVFASTGNEASATRIAAPACAPAAVAVAAVWDGDIGSRVFPGLCTDQTTRADQVACFSNTNADTDLLAPGAPITSAGIHGGTSVFAGTSQAAPHAAACAALLREASPAAGPDALEAALEAAPLRIVDPRSLLDFPRLDCAEAVRHVPEPERGAGAAGALAALAALGAARARSQGWRRVDSNHRLAAYETAALTD